MTASKRLAKVRVQTLDELGDLRRLFKVGEQAEQSMGTEGF